MKTDRFVVDTNTLISAILTNNTTISKTLDIIISTGQLVFSAQTMAELRAVMVREKFDKYVSLSKRLEFLNSLEAISLIIPAKSDFKVCRDPQDNMILNVAADAASSFIITGDQDLLILNPFNNISIITPSDFLSKYS